MYNTLVITYTCTIKIKNEIVGLVNACAYCTVGNFHGVLTFVLFVVHSAVMKISFHKKLMPTQQCVWKGHGQTIVAAWPAVLVLASNAPQPEMQPIVS